MTSTLSWRSTSCRTTAGCYIPTSREGREEALAIVRATIRSVLGARGIALGTEDDARLAACSELNVLMKWATSAATAVDVAGLFDAE